MLALVVGLVRPSLVRLASRKRVALVFGGATMVFGFVVGSLSPEVKSAQTNPIVSAPKPAASTAATVTPAPVIAKSVAPAPKPTPTAPSQGPSAGQQIEQLVYNVVHGTNVNKEPYVRNIDVIPAVDATNPFNADGSPNYTRWTVAVDLNIDGSKTLMDDQMGEIFYSLFSNRKDLYTVEISSYEPLTDKYGNTSDQKVYHAFLDGSDAYKVNWSADKDGLVMIILPKLWTVNFDASAVNPNLLSK